MKKLITIFLTLFMLLSTAACQPTPDEQIVVKKDTERMVERASAQENGTPVSMLGIPLENVTIAQGVILLSCNASAGAKQANQTTAIRQSEIIVFFFICFVLSHPEIIGSYLTLYL